MYSAAPDGQAMAKKQNDVGKLTFEEAIRALTDIVARIESGQTSLEDSLGQYEKGMALIKHCRTILQAAEKKIDRITAESGMDDSKPADEEKPPSGDRRASETELDEDREDQEDALF